MARTTRHIRNAAVIAATVSILSVTLAGCSSDSEVSTPAGFGDSASADANGQVTGESPTLSPPAPPTDPSSVPTTAPSDTPTGGPTPTPGTPSLPTTPGAGGAAVTGDAGLGLPHALDPNNLPLPTATVDGFTAEDLKSAHLWTAAFAKMRYANSGFWKNPKVAAPVVPASYYYYTTFMSPEKMKEMEEVLMLPENVEANLDSLDQLAPRPPQDADWMVPAVDDFVFGEAEFAAGEPTADGQPTVQVAFPVVSYGIYDVDDKQFYAVPIEERITLTLVKSDGDQPWLIQDWSAETTYGEPKKLDGKPVARQIAQYVDLGSMDPVDPSTLNSEEAAQDGNGGNNANN